MPHLRLIPVLILTASLSALAADSTPLAPRFEVDLTWPKPLPNHWILGQTIGVSVDSLDHVWIIHRPGSIEAGEAHASTTPPIAQCCAAAPPILEFDQAGNLLHAWGGPDPAKRYDWPDSNHGITVDSKGNVWIGGNGRGPESGRGAQNGQDQELGGVDSYHDNMVLKFTREGKFLLQIGKPSSSKGSNDTANLRLPAKTFIDPKANEVYVADGYGNHRVIVFDSETGQYKRHWGAYGNKPNDADPGPYKPSAPAAQQFRNPVHCAMLSNDGLVYVCDRVNDRIQVFRPNGTFVKEAIIEKNTLGSGSVWDIAFSPDPQQKFLYLADGENDRVHIVDRASLEVLTSFGEGGRQPGEFYGVHSIAADSKGNIYTTETYRGQRVQRFLYKGMAPVVKKDQGVLWPQNRSACEKCTGTYITNDEIQSYLKRVTPGIQVADQQIRALDVGKSNVDIGVVYRGKLDKPADQSVAEHDLVSEVYHVIDGAATLVLGPEITDPQPRPAENENVRLLNGPGNNGATIRNGATYQLKPGDVVVVPAGVGHWFTKIDDHIRYLMVRIDPDKVTPLKDEAASKADLAKGAR